MQPTIGRIVFYMARGSLDGKFPKTHRAAIITDVRPMAQLEEEKEQKGERFQVRVCVLNPEGLFFSDWLTEGEEGGQWSWPPRV